MQPPVLSASGCDSVLLLHAPGRDARFKTVGEACFGRNYCIEEHLFRRSESPCSIDIAF